jgi:hypothetical protein
MDSLCVYFTLVETAKMHGFNARDDDGVAPGLRPRILSLKSSKAPTNYFTPNILRKSWSRLVVSVVHLDALAFPVAAT